MMQNEGVDLSNNNNNNNNNNFNNKYDFDENDIVLDGRRRRISSEYSEDLGQDVDDDQEEQEFDDTLSSENYNFETASTRTGTENETADCDSDNRSSNEPVVKVKTLVEYHLEFLTKHPGEVFFYGCKLCTNRFTSRNSFLIHMKLHNVRKRYPCQHCDKAYDRKFQLVHHLRLHTEETPFECGVCFVAYATEPELIEHSKIHKSEKPFECRFCLKGFPQKKALIVHLRMHTGERPFHCPLCERTFTQKAHLQGHMVRIHIPKNKDAIRSGEAQLTTDKATALILQNIFAQKQKESRPDEPQDLSSHSENNTDSLPPEIDLSILSGQREKLIECDFCDKKFTYERNKINHMRKHGYTEGGSGMVVNNRGGEGRHQCGLCHMTFPSTALLMAHVLTHSGNNLTNSFTNNNNNNTNSLPFHCDICGREFNMKRNLIMHVKSHNTERPHQCPACEKNFKLKYFLELHVSKIHPHINIEDLDKKDNRMVMSIDDVDDYDDEDMEKTDMSVSSFSAANAVTSSPEKENTAVNLSIVQPSTNKRKQSQPKKVIVRTDLYETDSDTSSGEPYTDNSDSEMMDGYQEMEEDYQERTGMPLSLVQHQPKNFTLTQVPSMQMNFPQDLHHMKAMLNPKASVGLSDTQTISCPLCSLVVSSKAALALHVKDHEKNKTHQCTLCEKVYIQQASFEKHMKKHMLDEIAARQTKMIEQATMALKPDQFEQPHTGRIEGRKPLECNICRKKYAQPASFEKHMRLHSELNDVAALKNNISVVSNNKTVVAFDKIENLKNSLQGQLASVPNSKNDKAFINPSDFLEVSFKH